MEVKELGGGRVVEKETTIGPTKWRRRGAGCANIERRRRRRMR